MEGEFAQCFLPALGGGAFDEFGDAFGAWGVIGVSDVDNPPGGWPKGQEGK